MEWPGKKKGYVCLITTASLLVPFWIKKVTGNIENDTVTCVILSMVKMGEETRNTMEVNANCLEIEEYEIEKPYL